MSLCRVCNSINGSVDSVCIAHFFIFYYYYGDFCPFIQLYKPMRARRHRKKINNAESKGEALLRLRQYRQKIWQIMGFIGQVVCGQRRVQSSAYSLF